jgi:hypothetical protein
MEYHIIIRIYSNVMPMHGHEKLGRVVLCWRIPYIIKPQPSLVSPECAMYMHHVRKSTPCLSELSKFVVSWSRAVQASIARVMEVA